MSERIRIESANRPDDDSEWTYELKEHRGQFVECASCAAKSGSPVLCRACQHNLAVISRFSEERTRQHRERKYGRAGTLAADRVAAALVEVQRRFDRALSDGDTETADVLGRVAPSTLAEMVLAERRKASQ